MKRQALHARTFGHLEDGPNFVAPLDVPMKSELSEFSPKEQERALALAAYDPYNLATHMLASNYHMQAHIYLVA